MIAYMDTSALVKNYLDEAGSEAVRHAWETSSAIATSSVAYAESMATFHRKRREDNVAQDILVAVARAFRRDWLTIDVVELSDGLNTLIDRLVAAHPLRGFDAIHLASAVLVAETGRTETLFVCGDQRLLAAAESEGLNVQAV